MIRICLESRLNEKVNLPEIFTQTNLLIYQYNLILFKLRVICLLNLIYLLRISKKARYRQLNNLLIYNYSQYVF